MIQKSGLPLFFLPPNEEIEGALLLRYAVGMNSDERISADGGIPLRIPFMPAGVHKITASVNGAPGVRRIVVNELAAEQLQADLVAALDAVRAHRRARPAVYFDHRLGPAAAYPKAFVWVPGRGVMMEVERWSNAGREAVEGGSYGYVSPVFRSNRRTGEVLGLAEGVEVASVVNDPAFERIDPIMDEVAAARAFGVPVCNEDGVDEINAQGQQAGCLPPRPPVVSDVRLVQNGGTANGGGKTKQRIMDIAEIKKLLGLPEDAEDDAVVTAIRKLAAQAKQHTEEFKAAQEELKKKEEQVKCMRETEAQRRVDALVRKGILAPKEEDRIAAARSMAMADPDGFDKVFAGIQAPADMILAGKAQMTAERSNAEVLMEEMKAYM